jgi:predicted TPR repeat methyltransferase
MHDRAMGRDPSNTEKGLHVSGAAKALRKVFGIQPTGQNIAALRNTHMEIAANRGKAKARKAKTEAAAAKAREIRVPGNRALRRRGS